MIRAGAVLAIALGACARPAAAPPPPHNLEEATVSSTALPVAARWRGPIHLADGAAALEAFVVRDDAAYDALIARLPATRVQMKQPAPPSDDPLRARPPIDFATDMLVVLVRPATPSPPAIARVEADGARLTIRYVAPRPPPEARPYGIGGYAAVQVPRTDGVPALVGPRVVDDAAAVDAAVGELVTLRGPLSRTRIPTILGVDVDEGDATADRPAEASGWLEREIVTQEEIDEEVARSGQFANRGAGTFYRLVAPEGDGLAAARPR